jgi:hypothetical protein
MDITDAAVAEELQRRLVAIEATEAGDPVHGVLPSSDLWWSVAIVVASLIAFVVAL